MKIKPETFILYSPFDSNKTHNKIVLGPWADADSNFTFTCFPDNSILKEGFSQNRNDTFNSIEALYEEYLSYLRNVLNCYHGFSYSTTFYRILIGPWLKEFIEIVYDKHNRIARLSKIKNIEIKYKTYQIINSCVATNMRDWSRLTHLDSWNCYLISEILKIHGIGNVSGCEIIKVPLTTSYSNKLISYIYRLYNIFYNLNNESFYIKTYLHPFVLIRLGIFTSKFRDFIHPLNPNILNKIDSVFRNSEIDTNETKDINYICKSLILKLIPIAYLEGLKDLIQYTKYLKLKPKPKYIFTSNSHVSDDVFKLYSAIQLENGNTKLIIGQHGGHYGTARNCSPERHELNISNKYLTWGWTKNSFNNKICPVGFLKYSIARKFWIYILRHIFRPKKIVIINSGISKYPYRSDDFISPEYWKLYLGNILSLYSSLPIAIKNNVIIRNHEIRKSEADSFFQLNYSNINFHQNKYSELFSNKYLIVVTYNATVPLEFIFYNIPTMIYLNPIYWTLDLESKIHFEKLGDVGIFHNSVNSISHMIQEIYPNIEDWWFSKSVQEAVSSFKEFYVSDLNICKLKKTII